MACATMPSAWTWTRNASAECEQRLRACPFLRPRVPGQPRRAAPNWASGGSGWRVDVGEGGEDLQRREQAGPTNYLDLAGGKYPPQRQRTRRRFLSGKGHRHHGPTGPGRRPSASPWPKGRLFTHGTGGLPGGGPPCAPAPGKGRLRRRIVPHQPGGPGHRRAGWRKCPRWCSTRWTWASAAGWSISASCSRVWGRAPSIIAHLPGGRPGDHHWQVSKSAAEVVTSGIAVLEREARRMESPACWAAWTSPLPPAPTPRNLRPMNGATWILIVVHLRRPGDPGQRHRPRARGPSRRTVRPRKTDSAV